MVVSICATFINGPFIEPRADASALASTSRPPPLQPVDADPRRERAGVDAETRVARRPRAQAIGFVVAVQAELLLGTHGI